jgi:hypothetical protein
MSHPNTPSLRTPNAARTKTKQVLWFNWLDAQGHYEGYAAYTAPTPAGPYTRVRNQVNTSNACVAGRRHQNTRARLFSHPLIQGHSRAPLPFCSANCGDFHLFVDPADNTPCAFLSPKNGSPLP